MINKILSLYIKTSYFAQKFAGWSDPIEGFKNYIVSNLFFLSSGFVVFLFSFIPYGFFLWFVYAIFYYINIRIHIENRLEENVDFYSLNCFYEKLKVLQKLIYLVISILLLLLSIVSMISIVILLGNVKKLVIP